MIMMSTIQTGCTGIALSPLISVTHLATPRHVYLGVHSCIELYTCIFSYVNIVYTFVWMCASGCDTYTVYIGRNYFSGVLSWLSVIIFFNRFICTSGLHLLTALWLILVSVAYHTFHHLLFYSTIWYLFIIVVLSVVGQTDLCKMYRIV